MTRLDYPERIDVGRGYEAWVSRFSLRGQVRVVVFHIGTNDIARKFKSTGDRDVAIENARECARVLSEAA